MATLNLFKERRKNTFTLNWNGVQKDFYIPSDLTVGQLERIIERQIEIEKITKKEQEIQSNGGEGSLEEAERFFKLMVEQAYILLEHYQPEITIEDIKNNLTRTELLSLNLFWMDNQMGSDDDQETIKKKVLGNL